jgi:hypothetical protein
MNETGFSALVGDDADFLLGTAILDGAKMNAVVVSGVGVEVKAVLMNARTRKVVHNKTGVRVVAAGGLRMPWFRPRNGLRLQAMRHRLR